MTNGIAPARCQAYGSHSIPEESTVVDTSRKSDAPRRSVTFEEGLVSPPQGRPLRTQKPRGSTAWQQTTAADSNASYASNTSHFFPAPPDAQTDVLLNRLSETAKTFGNAIYSTHPDVAPTTTNPGCIEKTLVKVILINDGKEQECCLDANHVDIADNGDGSPPTRYIAGRSPASSNVFIDETLAQTGKKNESPEDFDRYPEFNKALVHAIESRQGLYQFVWPKTHQQDFEQISTYRNRTSGDGVHREKSMYEILTTAINRAKYRGHQFLINENYRITDIKKIKGKQLASGLDYFHYQISVTDLAGKTKFTIPMTQAGLPLTEGRLAEDQIARAHAILKSHRTLLPPTPEESKPVPEPMVISKKGRIRNATLIVFTSVSKRIDSGLLATPEQVDHALHDAIAAGYDARGTKKFIPSPTQIKMLRAALMQRLANRLANATNQAQNDFMEQREPSADDLGDVPISPDDVQSAATEYRQATAMAEPEELERAVSSNAAPRAVASMVQSDRDQKPVVAQSQQVVHNSNSEPEKSNDDSAPAPTLPISPAINASKYVPQDSGDKSSPVKSPIAEELRAKNSLHGEHSIHEDMNLSALVKPEVSQISVNDEPEPFVDVSVGQTIGGAASSASAAASASPTITASASASAPARESLPTRLEKIVDNAADEPPAISGASVMQPNQTPTSTGTEALKVSVAAISNAQPVADKSPDKPAPSIVESTNKPGENNIRPPGTARPETVQIVADSNTIDKSPRNPLTERNQRRGKSMLETIGLRREEIKLFQATAFRLRDNEGRGDCLFHALGGARSAPTLSDNAVIKLRAEIAEYVLKQTFDEKTCKNFYTIMANTFHGNKAAIQHFLNHYKTAPADATNRNDGNEHSANNNQRASIRNSLAYMNQNEMLTKEQFADFIKTPGRFAGDEEVQFWLDMDRNRGKTVVIIDGGIGTEKIVWFRHRKRREYVLADQIAGRVADEISAALAPALFEENVKKAEYPEHLAIYRSSIHFQRIVGFQSMESSAARKKHNKAASDEVENEEPTASRSWSLWRPFALNQKTR